MKLVSPQTLPLIVEAAIPQRQFPIFTLIGDIKRKHTRHSVEPAATALMLPFVITYGIRKVNHSATLRQRLSAALYILPNGFFHLTGSGKRHRMFFWIPARQVQQIGVLRYGDILFRIEERDTTHSAQHLQMFFINERERLLVTCHQDTQVARFPTADKLLIPFPRFPQRNRRLRQQQFPIHALLQ